MQGSITEQFVCPFYLFLFFNFFSSLTPHCQHPPPVFTVSLDHALQSSSHDLREGIKEGEEKKKKARRKVGQGDLFFFPTVHGGRGWRCYCQLDEERGLMGRQGLVARRSHSELGQRQRLRLVNGLSYRGRKAANEP